MFRPVMTGAPKSDSLSLFDGDFTTVVAAYIAYIVVEVP